MSIPILNGVYTDGVANVRTSYPVNLVPVPKSSGVSDLYLRPADGLVQLGTGPGVDRGGINWNGVCYRVMGTKLVRIAADGTTTTLGDVGSGGQVTFDYSFDRLGVASGGRLYYWDNATLTQVTDVDLGTVLDFVWVDGYFLTTDGTSLVVTELNSPTLVDPLKYGSSEIDPDVVYRVLKLRSEVHALNRHTIEVFNNVGGDNFPFQRVDGAQIQKGVVGTHAACVFVDAIAFLGSGRNEPVSVYIGASGQAVKIATREIDQLLATYSDATLSGVTLEARVDIGHQHLYVHLPDKTLVYDAAASKEAEAHVWFVLTSSTAGFSQYRAMNFVYCYNKWLCGDPTSSVHGYTTDTISSHYGDIVRWEFGTLMLYNQAKGAIVHELELICLTGRVPVGVNPTVSTSYSVDGETWSQDRSIYVGKVGDRTKRVRWTQQGLMRNWRLQRFRGTSQAFLSIMALEAVFEAVVN